MEVGTAAGPPAVGIPHRHSALGHVALERALGSEHPAAHAAPPGLVSARGRYDAAPAAGRSSRRSESIASSAWCASIPQ